MGSKIKFYFFWLSLVCIGVFILQNIIPGFTNVFVLNSDAVDNFEIWRFVSAMFLHGGMVHLMYNLFALLLFGFILEKLIGSKKFLIVFFVSGIVANLVSVNFYGSSLGASGAIYGVLGAIIILRPMMMVWAFGVMMPMFIAGILWIVGDIMGVFGFGKEGVGNIAHLSGIGFGLLFGLWSRFFVNGSLKGVEKVEVPEEIVDDWERRWM
jgi:uncharacterized protein